MNKVYSLIKKIPKGRVSSYNIIANKLKLHPRRVAKILNKNCDKDIPCHRVVMNSGKLGGYNKGTNRKIVLLRKEGIKIKNNKILNFKRILYQI